MMIMRKQLYGRVDRLRQLSNNAIKKLTKGKRQYNRLMESNAE
jgi:hypothetical protein